MIGYSTNLYMYGFKLTPLSFPHPTLTCRTRLAPIGPTRCAPFRGSEPASFSTQ